MQPTVVHYVSLVYHAREVLRIACELAVVKGNLIHGQSV